MTAEDEMESMKNIKRILKSQPTLEGARVRLRRAFGYNEVPLLDRWCRFDLILSSFLLFRSSRSRNGRTHHHPAETVLIRFRP